MNNLQYKVEITETCLRNGYNQRFDRLCGNYMDMKYYLDNFCAQRGIDYNKIISRYRSMERGTSKGCKVFYTPQPGIRIYVWINIYAEQRLIFPDTPLEKLAMDNMKEKD